MSTRYLVIFSKSKTVSNTLYEKLTAPLYDRMTQCIYTAENLPRQSFNEGLPKDLEPWFVVPLLSGGKAALEHVNQKLGKYLFIFIWNHNQNNHGVISTDIKSQFWWSRERVAYIYESKFCWGLLKLKGPRLTNDMWWTFLRDLSIISKDISVRLCRQKIPQSS